MRQKRKAADALLPILTAGKAINVAELAEELIHAMGGVREFAALYIKELKETKPGGIAKARMLEGVMRIVTSASVQAKGSKKAEDEMSVSELEAVVLGVIQKSEGQGGP